MRPASIIWFERLYFGALLIGIVNVAGNWDEAMIIVSPAFTVAIRVLVFGLYAAMALLVSRKRSEAAKWVLVVLAMVGLLGLAMIASRFAMGEGSGWLFVGFATGAIQIAALSLLFSPSARAWLGSGTAAAQSEEQLEQTFE